MAIVVSTFHLPHQKVCVVDPATNRQVQFSTPADFVLYLERSPEYRDDLMKTQWYVEELAR